MTISMPGASGDLADEYPDVWKAYTALGKASADCGPLTPRQRRLVKLALSIGAGSEGAVHSHTRRAKSEGIEPAAIIQIGSMTMRFTSFTDYALRVLMRMAGEPGRAFTAADLATEFRVSRNHLAKVISALAAANLLETRRGSGGGAMLHARPRTSGWEMSWRPSKPTRRWWNALPPGPVPAH